MMDRRLNALAMNGLAIIGAWEATDKGMIFERGASWLRDHLGKTAAKPLFDCPICMASFWGAAFLLTAERKPFRPLWHVLCLAGLMKLVVTWVKRR